MLYNFQYQDILRKLHINQILVKAVLVNCQ